MQTRFDAILLAGHDPDRNDPLVDVTGQPHKALVPIDEQPMVWHVVRALHESHCVDRIVIVGLGAEAGIDFGCAVDYLPEQGSLFDNAAFGFEHLAKYQDVNRHALLLSADVPLLTGEIITWYLQACKPLEKDMYWGVVEKAVMEATFPHINRTYLRLTEGEFCNGELYLSRIAAALRKQQIFRDMIQHRKNVPRQLRLLGPTFVIKFLLRRLAMADILGFVRRRLQIEATAVIMPFAEAGMDVDKPEHLDQVIAYLQQKQST